MNNRSIAWWLRQIGLPQYTKTLEREYYGLEGLLQVTDGDLREVGVDHSGHRAIILSQLGRHQHRLDAASEGNAGIPGRATRKHSLGSSLDLLKLSRRQYNRASGLFRLSILPRLQRKDRSARLSSSCTELEPLEEALCSLAPGQDQTPPPVDNCRYCTMLQSEMIKV